MGYFSDIIGTLSSVFQIGKGGPKLKNNGGAVEHRNNADTAFAVARVALPAGENDAIRIRSLITFIDDGVAEGFAGAYKETTPLGNPFPAHETWYTDATKTTKIIDLAITRDARQFPTLEEWTLYASDGVTVVHIVSDTIAYNGPFETTRTRTVT